MTQKATDGRPECPVLSPGISVCALESIVERDPSRKSLHTVRAHSLAHREVEIGSRIGLLAQREVPPLFVIRPKPALSHRLRQQGAVALRLRTHGPVGWP